jgi:hypothetical protein
VCVAAGKKLRSRAAVAACLAVRRYSPNVFIQIVSG